MKNRQMTKMFGADELDQESDKRIIKWTVITYLSYKTNIYRTNIQEQELEARYIVEIFEADEYQQEIINKDKIFRS